MITRKSFWRTFVAVVVLAMPPIADAGDLSESIQLYFDGNLQAANQQLSALIEKDDADPRLYYFRGLARARLGDVAAADRDFQQGAQLELAVTSAAVGQALQRVQGPARLRLEKHRRMARLMSRRRTQAVAPRPVTRDPAVQLTIGVTTDDQPTFRLASEVPLRRAQLPDPFADDPLRILAREQQPAGPDVTVVPAPAAPAVVEDAPVGSGLAASAGQSAVADGETVFEDLADDPFALASSDEETAAAAPAADISDKPAKKSAGVFGAVFRAFRNATVPKLDTGALLPFPGGNAAPRPQDQFPAESFPTEDPFQDSGDDAELFGEGDAFGEEDDPFGTLDPE